LNRVATSGTSSTAPSRQVNGTSASTQSWRSCPVTARRCSSVLCSPAYSASSVIAALADDWNGEPEKD
jgi:hypothetical protein